MVRDGTLQAPESAVVEEARGDFQVPQRRRPEHVAQGRIAFRLLEAEILVLFRTIENDVAGSDSEYGRDLRTADPVGAEIAEHLVGSAGDGVAGDALALAEENERAPLLRAGQGTGLAAGKAIQRCVGRREGGLELSDRQTAHVDGDAAGSQGHA